MQEGFGFPGINQWHSRVYNTRETSDTSAHETLGSQPTWQRHTRGGVYGGGGVFLSKFDFCACAVQSLGGDLGMIAFHEKKVVDLRDILLQ